MKKSIIVLVFMMLLTMIVPVYAAAKISETKAQEEVNFNGKYVVMVKVENKWTLAGSLIFDKYQSEKTIDISRYITKDNVIIKVMKDGGGAGYIDLVLLDGKTANSANKADSKLLNKLSRGDFDVTNVDENGVILEFSSKDADGKLSVVGRIENEVISKEPLQFPVENNYKTIDEISDFYTYTIDSTIGVVTVDGILDEVEGKEPFVKDYRVPGSGHPAGDTYFWVMNDNENIYLSMDVTPDNTFDGDKDYAKVYVNTSDGIKEFKVSVPETVWGNTSFTYTENVEYEHKVYEFVIPFDEIKADGQNLEELDMAFVVYGTVALENGYHNPDVAYDPVNDLYLSVFESVRENYISDIHGQLVDNAGIPLGEEFVIKEKFSEEGYGYNYLYDPSVAYDSVNNLFLVIWSSSDYMIYARTVSVGPDNNISLGEPFEVTSNGEPYYYYDVYTPHLAFDDEEGSFLVVWTQEDYLAEKNYIKGQFLLSNGTFIGTSFPISDEDLTNEENPSVCYSYGHESFLVAWERLDEVTSIEARVVKTTEETPTPSDTIIVSSGNYVHDPSVSINELSDQFLITWEKNRSIHGSYIDLNILGPIVVQELGRISEDDELNAIHPTSFYDGDESMLCLWNGNNNDSEYNYVRLKYINQDVIFNTDDPEEIEYESEPYHDTKTLDSTGNSLGKVLVAYTLNGSAGIGYRLIGEQVIIPDPVLEFENAPYIVNKEETIQAAVKLLDYDGVEEQDVTEDVYYDYDSEYISVDDSGLITGLKVGETTLYAHYPKYFEKSFTAAEYSQLTAEATVVINDKLIPTISFIGSPYSVKVGDTEQTIVKLYNYNNIEEQVVTSSVIFDVRDLNIAEITSSGAIKGKVAGTTTISAIYYYYPDVEYKMLENEFEAIEIRAEAVVNVTPKSEVTKPTSSSGSVKTPIGQILVDNKVITNIYREDVSHKNGLYTFSTDKVGDNAKLWLNGSFYKEVSEKQPDGMLDFIWDGGSYSLPLNCDEVLTELKDISNSKINIVIDKIEDEDIVNSINEASEEIGGKNTFDTVEFKVFVEGSNRNVEIDSFDFYLTRTINHLGKVDGYSTTAMKYIEDKEVLTFAPSVFDEKFDSMATIKYRGNGIFTIFENPQTFDDVQNHWAKMNIEKLAARNIAFGKSANEFNPEDNITRAEFAVMIARALAITEEEGTESFQDVKDQWFTEDIKTSYDAGLINGKSDGNFYPDEKIMRKDMAVMIYNALKFADSNTKVSNADNILSMFKDNENIDNYAKESIALCADAKIIIGRDTGDFDPNSNATRAEASAIIERMLKHLEFMN